MECTIAEHHVLINAILWFIIGTESTKASGGWCTVSKEIVTFGHRRWKTFSIYCMDVAFIWFDYKLWSSMDLIAVGVRRFLWQSQNLDFTSKLKSNSFAIVQDGDIRISSNTRRVLWNWNIDQVWQNAAVHQKRPLYTLAHPSPCNEGVHDDTTLIICMFLCHEAIQGCLL